MAGLPRDENFRRLGNELKDAVTMSSVIARDSGEGES